MESRDAHFEPPFCPNPSCDFHANPEGWRFKKDGTHTRKCDLRIIQRFRCVHCRRSFSTQTYATDYWLKRPDVLVPVLHGLISCSGFRQIARTQEVSPSTVALQAGRLGRHMQLFHEQTRPRCAPAEPIVIDGFETFEFSQYWPTHLNTVVGADSHFIYATTIAELRRKGRMTDKQKQRRAELEQQYGKPRPNAIRRTVEEAVALTVPAGSPEVVVRSDEHKAYPPALRTLADRQLRHETTSSKAPRTPQNPLFPVNTLHGLIRHNGANHKRETIAWSKRNQSMWYRDVVHTVWRNYVKHTSELRRDASPAMRIGVVDGILSWSEILSKRLFVTRVKLPEVLEPHYWGRLPTRQIPTARDHRLRFAF
jgi:transposase-like protein